MTKFAYMKHHARRFLLGIVVFLAYMILSITMLNIDCQLAFASEESSSGIGAILPNMIEFIPMLVAFIVLWAILAKFGWPMFAAMLDKREKTIRDALAQSEEAKVEAEKLLEEYKLQLENAKAESVEIVANARHNAEVLEADLKEQAEKNAAEIIEKAKQTIEAEKKAAVADLQSSVADMTVDVASKLIANDLSDDEHRRIIEKYVKEAGSF